MNQIKQSRWRILWILPPLAVGILVLMFMAGGKQPPGKADLGEPRQPVRVIQAQQLELIPRARGYGEVQPEKIWAAVAQVAGRVIETYPRLRNGEIVPRDTLLYRIDPVNYELQLAQARAELAELEVLEKNTRASLDIDQRNLAIAQREQERVARLSKTGTASSSDVDSAERTMLSARTAVQNTENSLALLPTQRRLLEAKVSQAERDLAHTEVKAPFDLRIANVNIEKDQYVGVGQTLFNGDAVGRVEIVAQVAMSSLRNLFLGRGNQIPDITEMHSALPGFTGFRPVVQMDMGSHVAEWEADFVRFSDEVDPQTRTIGVVIGVDQPLQKVIPGKRPPLSKGMFVQVVIRGHAQADRLVLPRTAIRNGKIYVLDAEQRLQVRPVSILYSMDSISVIDQGLQAGETVVVSDLIPAVPGMLLEPKQDNAMQQDLLAAARGEK